MEALHLRDSTSQWVSRTWSALRTATACLLCLLASWKALPFMEFPVFSYVIAMLIVGESSLGKATVEVWSLLQGTAQSVCASLLILPALGPHKFSLPACLACIFLTSFAFSYYPVRGQHAMRKRVALALNCIIYVSAYTKPESTHPVFFPLKLAATTLLGTACAIAALVIPVPRLSAYQFRCNTKRAANLVMVAFLLLVDASNSGNDGQIVSACTRAKLMSAAASELCEKLQQKREEAEWEPVWRRPSKAVTNKLVSSLRNMNSSLLGMRAALHRRLETSCLVQESSQKLQEQVSTWSLLVLTRISQILDEAKLASSEEGAKVDAMALLGSIATGDESWRYVFYLNVDRILKEGSRLLTGDSEPAAHTCDHPPPAPKVVHWTSKARSFLKLDVDLESLLQSLKISLSLMAAAYLGVLYRKDYGYWSTITVALGLYNSQAGGTFKTTSLRIQGTTIGTTYGYLVALLAGKNVVKILLALFPWVVLTSFLRESKMLKLTGASSAFISAVIIVAKKRTSPVQDFTLVRVTLAVLGLSIFLMVEALICPRRAYVLARNELALNLKQLRVCLDRSFRLLHATSASCRKCLVSEAEDHIKKLKAGINRLNSLVAEARAEPEFWSSSFPADIYSSLAKGLENMADNLQLMTSLCPQAQHSPADFTRDVKELESQLIGAVDGLRRLQLWALEKSEVKDIEKQNTAKPGSSPLIFTCSMDQVRKLEAAANKGELTGTKLSCAALAFCCQELVKETMDLQKSTVQLDQDVP